jgi:hypothetical protein
MKKECGMGHYANEGSDIVYRQEDGEITAWLTGFEEKMELGHKGSGPYRWALRICVAIGAVYLLLLFLLI